MRHRTAHHPPTITIIVALALGLASAPVAGGIIHVHGEVGVEHYDGQAAVYQGERRGPVRSLQRAVDVARPGDTILMYPASLPYRESVVIDGRKLSTTSATPLIIEGNGAELSGLEPVDSLDWRRLDERLYMLDRTYRGPYSLFVDGAPAERQASPNWGARPHLDAGQFAVWEAKLLFRLEPGKFLRDHAFAVSQRGGGLMIHRASHVLVRNLRIRGYRHDAVEVRGPCRNVVFENCQWSDNGRTGISLYTNAEALLSRCAVGPHPTAGVLARNRSRVTSWATEVEPSSMLLENSSEARLASEPTPPPEPAPYLPIEWRSTSARPATAPPGDVPEAAAPAEKAPPKPAAKPGSFFD